MANELPQQHAELAREICEALMEAATDADRAAVVERVRRMWFGLPAEDEFSVICAWLGKCELLHKLDQHQVPVAANEKYRVPDLLARFSTQTNSTPVLIEVKAHDKGVLSFTPSYHARLLRYAELMGMPLLIAWKFHRVWTLFDIRHMKLAVTNYKISFSDAERQNLLGVLAGDLAFALGKGAGIRMRGRREGLLETSDDGSTETWKLQFDDVSYVDYQGNARKDLPLEVAQLFILWDLKESVQCTSTHLHMEYTAGEGVIEFAHSALAVQLDWEGAAGINWRSELRKDVVAASLGDFAVTLDKGMREKIVSHIFHVQPETMPDFVTPAAKSRGAPREALHCEGPVRASEFLASETGGSVSTSGH